MPTLTDKQLIEQYLKGDEKSLEILIGQYLKPVYGLIFRYVKNAAEAEDIVQDTFIRAWKNLKKFDRERNFQAWIFTIAKNASLDFLKKKKAVPFSAFENEAGENILNEIIGEIDPRLENLTSGSEAKEKLDHAMDKMPAASRDLISLYHQEDFTLNEIAETLGESANTVKSRYRRAMINLKKILTKT